MPREALPNHFPMQERGWEGFFFLSFAFQTAKDAIHPFYRYLIQFRLPKPTDQRLPYDMWQQLFKQQIWPIKDKLFRFAWSLLGNASEAEDVVQETFLRAASQSEQGLDWQNAEAWCMTVARNLSYDQLRLRKRQGSVMGEAGTSTTPDVEDSSHTPDWQLIHQEQAKQVMQLLEQLPATQREVMQLRDVEGHSYKEIAKILQIEVSQVKATLAKARKRIRQQMIQLEAYGN